MDVFTKEKRSHIMSRIRSKGNATTELRMVGLLRENKISGWRRHCKLHGTPDFTFRAERVVLFTDGCFWHGHDCVRRRVKTNRKFWDGKIARNIERDSEVNREYRRMGWKVVRVWECEMRSGARRKLNRLRKLLEPHRRIK